MIRITRPAARPRKLADGTALVEAMQARRLADPEAGGSAEHAFEFLKRVYGASSVKSALRRAQHDKCCFCEGHFAGQSPGDVEHFRPKGRVQQGAGTAARYPGYFWLAYTWENLLYSCENCNRSGKKDLFPLVDDDQRVLGPDDAGHVEAPLLVDPGSEDPRAHVRFEGATAYGITDRGRATVDILKLERGDLRVARLRHLKMLDAFRSLAQLDPAMLSEEERANRERAVADLAASTGPEQPYSSMAIDFVAANAA